MRNLESIVNRPPVSQPICAAGSNCTNFANLDGEATTGYPINERPIAAFMSAFKNLGGGSTKGSDAFTTSFQLTEIPPNTIRNFKRHLKWFLTGRRSSYRPNRRRP